MIKLILPALIIYALTSCGGPSTATLTRADSVNIAMALCGDTVPKKEFRQTAALSTFADKRDDDQLIPPDIAQKMILSYHTPRHQLNMVNQDGKTLKGFVLEPDDFKKIIDGSANMRTLSFYFGIANYEDADAGAQPAKYTLLIVPVDKNNKAMKNSVFDYVLPCPNNCPDDGFEPLP